MRNVLPSDGGHGRGGVSCLQIDSPAPMDDVFKVVRELGCVVFIQLKKKWG